MKILNLNAKKNVNTSNKVTRLDRSYEVLLHARRIRNTSLANDDKRLPCDPKESNELVLVSLRNIVVSFVIAWR